MDSRTPSVSQEPPPETARPEKTRELLLEGARGRFGAIPSELIADHVLEVTEGADFPVREAALDALVRRADFAARDGLCVATRPVRAAVLGAYATERVEGYSFKKKQNGKRRKTTPGGRGRRSSSRPYVAWLRSLSPFRGSCDCADFTRNSLGLCKHLLVVLSDALGRARSRRATGAAAFPQAGVVLDWWPVLPLRGPLDRLLGLRLEGECPRSLRFAFQEETLVPAQLTEPEARLRVLRALAKVIAQPGAVAVSPAARAILAEELGRAERRSRNEAHAAQALSHTKGLKRKLYRYQQDGVERFLRAGRLLLADDMGLGKTTQAIAACHALFKSGKVRRGLLVVPASLKPQWLREWNETSDVPVWSVDGNARERQSQYERRRSGFLVVGYEQLLRDAPHIQALQCEMVVLDEAQRIKNYATKSAVYVKALTPEYRLVLTGTPLENRLEELASILDWVDDVALAPKWRLVPWYTQWDGDGGSKAGARNLNVLRQRFEPCLLRRVRKEVLSQLPSRTDTRVPVEMTEQQMDAHDELDLPIKRIVASARKRPLLQKEFLWLMSLLTQQRIISNGLGQRDFDALWPSYENAKPERALLEGLFSPKLLELRRLIGELCVDQERKVVVFSQWRRMLRLANWSVGDVLRSSGLRSVFFTGAERQAQRARAVADFHDDLRTRVMFLSDAGGVGLNLQRAANACINLELPWNPSVLEQRIGRIYRLGQKKPIDVYNLVSEEGIEARISAIVSTKRALFNGLFDGESDEIRFDSAVNFVQRVEALLDPGTVPSAPTPAARAAELAAEAELEDEPDASVEGLPADSDAAPMFPTVPAAAHDASQLFSRLKVERRDDGGIRIEAPPEAAESLATLFAGMAQLLQAAAGTR